jgi:hypothetical protein
MDQWLRRNKVPKSRPASTCTRVEQRPANPHFQRMDENTERKLGIWGWFAIVVLTGFLIAAIAYAIHAWNALGGVGISPLGWTFLVCGVVFYSSRHHYDQ